MMLTCRPLEVYVRACVRACVYVFKASFSKYCVCLLCKCCKIQTIFPPPCALHPFRMVGGGGAASNSHDNFGGSTHALVRVWRHAVNQYVMYSKRN